MLRINLDGIPVVRNCLVKLALLAVGKATIMIEVGLGWLNLNSMGETLNGLVIVSPAV